MSEEELEFPRKGSSHSGTDVAYTAEFSPKVNMNGPNVRFGKPYIEGEWYRVETVVVPAEYGVPCKKVIPGYELKGFFEKAGAEAMRWMFLARRDELVSGMFFETRIVRHEIKYNYEETAVGVEDENKTPLDQDGEGA